MSRVFVTRRLPGHALSDLRAVHEVEVWPQDQPPSRTDLIERLRDSDALICLLTDRIDADVLNASQRLKVIANLAVGVDNIDLVAATANHIPVGNTPDVLTDATADHTFALLLASARRIVEAQGSIGRGEWTTWHPMAFLGHPVSGATLLIVGFGRIGHAVAERARGFHMNIQTVSNANRSALFDLLPGSDFVSLHCPLTLETRHLVGRPAFERMKASAHLVNTARGALVDTEALVEALQNGLIAGAALDVSDPEPLPPDHPLMRAPNLTITPHIASATHKAREQMADICVQNVLAALAGQRIPNCVNPLAYD